MSQSLPAAALIALAAGLIPAIPAATTSSPDTHQDSIMLTTVEPSDSAVRVVVPGFRSLVGTFSMKSRWRFVRGDTLVLATPVILAVDPGLRDVQLESVPGDPRLRVAWDYPLAGSTKRVYCRAEGYGFRLMRDLVHDQPYFKPDATGQVTCEGR
jgi:hypothetical protein